MYAVIRNTPGYLPEGDPIVVDTLDEARSALADEIERDWDAEYNGAESAEDRLAIDARYLDAHTGANNVTAGDYVAVEGEGPHGLPVHYSIDIVEDEDNGSE